MYKRQSVFSTIIPEEAQITFSRVDYTYVTNLIHKNIAYVGASNTEVYDNDELKDVYKRQNYVMPKMHLMC